MKRIITLAFALLLCSCSTKPVGNMPNNRIVDMRQNIRRGGQPTALGFDVLYHVFGITNIVKLNTVDENDESAALKYPITIWYCAIDKRHQFIDEPDEVLIEAAVNAIGLNTLVHCTHGEDRTGLIIALWRVQKCGWTPDAAEAEMLANGFHKAEFALWRYWQKHKNDRPISDASAMYRLAAFEKDPVLPDQRLTPGDVMTNVTVEQITQRGYANILNGGARHVTESLKRRVFIEYFGSVPKNPGDYEIDHLISIELGGSNSISNLWPEAYAGPWGARTKDKLEDRMASLVRSCLKNQGHDRATQLLHQFQREIATNWITAFRKYCETNSVQLNSTVLFSRQ